ncbi:transposon polyprotein reverse transcriptase [Penicillium angulare]|uniref:transposon polyprotein reverse transcriptase n=1 Tax=Penicillium angulare TaxID=116970 RepID=UPI00254009EF|nr:transposon polyprotein reverse transcriptase [Penicillium angulare]KAJ5291444.1 transposon polyprotein reverse transcriptase [Penicillium angulare]
MRLWQSERGLLATRRVANGLGSSSLPEDPASQDEHLSDASHGSSDEIGTADDEYESDNDDSGAILSKYFNPSKHAGMAKRKVTDIPTVAPRKSRRATHDSRDVELEQSDSDLVGSDDDSWYYSDDGKISRAYWQFVTKHGDILAR